MGQDSKHTTSPLVLISLPILHQRRCGNGGLTHGPRRAAAVFEAGS